MIRVAASIVAVGSLFAATAAWACGGPPPAPVPGRAGTTVVEAGGSLSVFTATTAGYSWDRLQLPGTTRVHIADITGSLDGSVETDVRVDSAITSQGGELVKLTVNGAVPVSRSAGAQTSAFGAALDSKNTWQVLAYEPVSKTVTLYSEGSGLEFTTVAALNVDCGNVTMLDTVVEPGDTVVGLCGQVALELRDGALVSVELPVKASSMVRGSSGNAVAYGVAANGTDLVVMSHVEGGLWKTSSTIAAAAAPQLMFPRDESSIVVKQPAGYVAYTLNNDGVWQASSALDATLPVTSAVGGAPAHVLSGQYELTLHSTDGSPNGAWTATDLGALGVAPQPADPSTNKASFGCTIVGTGVPFALIAAMSLARMKRRERK